ncbi:conserved hypothetical protein [Alkaliphilus metalliredigens QYMF]|uniref:Uncharacterized protein n=1 Tax=Alkaliphilus metalliredigens (strain QYMF) TaxID=293826 RepID=A6TTW5_ALKMQ|nr:hypothetical protein [Alkaliphilus metalliredigens]ABR49633.1 conserved hypothetical protein [Alkaliphilus metalliredigens QYMF]
MKTLNKDCFDQASKSIMKYGRALEKSLYQKHFNNGTDQSIMNELKKFQNEDGGFGQGIESDFRLPSSSPMATSVGLGHLSKLDDLEESQEMIQAAIGYLETSFDKDKNGWFAVPKEVNDFPHAPWWHFNEADGMTVIDRNWGNPSAEILAYLYQYRQYVKKLDVDGLVDYAIRHIENVQEIDSENEIFCYIKLYDVLPEELQKRLYKRISLAIEQVIIYDEEKWHEYVPIPVDFVKSSNSNQFGVVEAKLNRNLDFILNELESNGKINPPWGESFYEGDLKDAYNEWIGLLTLKALVNLDGFERIEE